MRAAAQMDRVAAVPVEVWGHFVTEDPYLGPATVMRHYVTPVRHKFWMTLSDCPGFTA
jgi:hypothetical protein